MKPELPPQLATPPTLNGDRGGCVIYHCRACSEVFEAGLHVPACRWAMTQMLLRDGRETWHPYHSGFALEVVTSHQCSDTQSGIADFAGFRLDDDKGGES